MNDKPTLPVEKLAAPARRALANQGIHDLEKLAQYSESEIMELHGIGKNALKVLKDCLKSAGLSFK